MSSFEGHNLVFVAQPEEDVVLIDVSNRHVRLESLGSSATGRVRPYLEARSRTMNGVDQSTTSSSLDGR